MYNDPAQALLDSLLGRTRTRPDQSATDGGLTGILRNMSVANTYNQSLSSPLAGYPNYRAPFRAGAAPSPTGPGVKTDDYIYGTSPEGDAEWRQRERAGWQAEADLNTLPVRPSPFDTDALAASYGGDPMTAGMPNWMPSESPIEEPEYPTSPKRLPTWVGEVDQSYKPLSNFVGRSGGVGTGGGLARLPQQGWVAPAGASPAEAAADHADSLRTQDAIQQGNMALAAALRGNAERDAQLRRDRNIGQRDMRSNDEWLMANGGPGFARSGRGPGGGAYEREFAGPATQRVGLVRDDGFNFDPTPRKPFIDRSSDVSRNGYVSYQQSRDAQRQRLADRNLSPERIAQLMGGPRPGPDLGVMRAVNQSNMRAGINPRLSQALALDAAGGAMSGGATMALRDSLLGVPGAVANSIQDKIALERWGLEKPVVQAQAAQAAGDIANPEKKLEREIESQNKARELAARGIASDPTVIAMEQPETQTLYGNDYLRTGKANDELLRALQEPLTNDTYDDANSHFGNLFGLLGRGGYTPSTDEEIYVKHILQRYPQIPEAAIRKFYREKNHLAGTQETMRGLNPYPASPSGAVKWATDFQ